MNKFESSCFRKRQRGKGGEERESHGEGRDAGGQKKAQVTRRS